MDAKADFFRHSDAIQPANEVLYLFVCLFIYPARGGSTKQFHISKTTFLLSSYELDSIVGVCTHVHACVSIPFKHTYNLPV